MRRLHALSAQTAYAAIVPPRKHGGVDALAPCVAAKEKRADHAPQDLDTPEEACAPFSVRISTASFSRPLQTQGLISDDEDVAIHERDCGHNDPGQSEGSHGVQKFRESRCGGQDCGHQHREPGSADNADEGHRARAGDRKCPGSQLEGAQGCAFGCEEQGCGHCVKGYGDHGTSEYQQRRDARRSDDDHYRHEKA